MSTLRSLPTETDRRRLKIVFCFFLLLLFLYRYYILWYFGFRYTDSDQTIMWEGTVDYASGRFYEPRFYGQSYNTMLESLLAVPFYKLGMPLRYALPLVTTILTLLPYALLALVTFKRKSALTGILVLGFAGLMPVNYDLITTLSRGFVPGLAIAGLLVLLLFREVKGSGWFFAGFVAVIAYSVNANSILFSLPVLFYLWIFQVRNLQLYIFGTAGAVCGIAVHLLVQHFYAVHPEIVLHNYEISVSSAYFWRGITHIGRFFDDIVPIFHKMGWMLIPAAVILAITFLRVKRKKEAWIALSVTVLLLIPLLVSKVHDGTDTIFFSPSRMFLGVPLVFALLLSFFEFRSNRIVFILLTGCAVMYIYKLKRIDTVVAEELKKDTVIGVIETDELMRECGDLSAIARKYKAELIVINNHWYYDFYNYGCPACVEELPPTIRPSYDRRIWRLKEVTESTYGNILLIDLSRDFSEEFEMIDKLPEKAGFYLVKDNRVKTMELFSRLKVPVRSF